MFLQVPERLADCVPDEFGTTPASARCDLFQTRGNLVVQFDEDRFHMEQYMLKHSDSRRLVYGSIEGLMLVDGGVWMMTTEAK